MKNPLGGFVLVFGAHLMVVGGTQYGVNGY
jgi:hypothetical protein